MRKIVSLLVGLVACLFVYAVPAQAASVLRLQDNRLILEKGGKATPLSADEVPVETAKNASGQPLSGLRYCCIGVDIGKARGIVPGLYLFDARGKKVAFAPTEAAEFCAEVRLSPGKTILAMDSGASLIRSWFFFTFPDMKPLGEVVSYQAEGKPSLLWEGDDGVVFSSMETEGHKRACGYDPCGPVSVRAYFFATRKAVTLLTGTDLCDFTLTGFSPTQGTVAANKRCLPSAAAWKTYPENAPVERITVKCPVRGHGAF